MKAEEMLIIRRGEWMCLYSAIKSTKLVNK